MKKLRMIITAVVVLAIVGSAFAFKAKGIGRFCVLDAASSNDNCTTYLAANQKKTTALSGISWKYAPCWDQDPVVCTAVNNHLCTETTKLTTD